MLKRIIRVYGRFSLNEIKRQFAYKGTFYLFVLCSLFMAFISYFLWKAIYANSAGTTLGGLTKNEMVIYVFITYVTSNTIMHEVGDYIADDVMQGSVAMNLIKPIQYRATLVAKAFGKCVYNFFVPCIFILIGVEVYKKMYLQIGTITVTRLCLYMISLLFSFFVYALFDFMIGLIAFVTTYVFGLSLAKEAILDFLSGRMIPLSFFPVVLGTALQILPFSSMVYDPVMIYLGKYSLRTTFYVLGKQFVWIILLYLLGDVLWKKVTRRLVVLGG